MIWVITPLAESSTSIESSFTTPASRTSRATDWSAAMAVDGPVTRAWFTGVRSDWRTSVFCLRISLRTVAATSRHVGSVFPMKQRNARVNEAHDDRGCRRTSQSVGKLSNEAHLPIPGIASAERRLSLVRNQSQPARRAQASWMASGGLTVGWRARISAK